jgi:hypothetical protein
MSKKWILLGGLSLAVGVVALLGADRTTDRVQIGDRLYDRVELRLNAFTQSTQARVALDMDVQGNVVTAWDSRRQQAGTYGVYARWIGADGALGSAEEAVNLHTASMQTSPAVSVGDDGRPWFAWSSVGQDGSAGAIVARRTGDETLVNARTHGEQRDATVARRPDGGAVVAWSSHLGGVNEYIAVRLLDADGTPTTDEIQVTTGDHADIRPSVDVAGDGTFLVAFSRTTPDGTIEGVFTRAYAADGTPRGDVVRLSAPGADCVEPSVAASDHGFAVGWMRLDAETDYDVMVRRVDLAGSPTGAAFCAHADRAGWQSGVTLDLTPDGQMAVAWHHYHEDGDADILARVFAADGEPIGPESVITRMVDGNQELGSTSARRVALGSDGRLAVAWHGDSGQGDDSAANVTVLLPTEGGLRGALASVTRTAQNWLAGRGQADLARLDATAAPHVPPSFSPADVSAEDWTPESVVHRGAEVGFDAVFTTGWTPPDPHLAVGPSDVVVMANGSIRSFEKDGTLQWGLDINGAAGFWGPVGAGDAGGFVFDPEIIYDVLDDRFVAMANERSGGRSYFLVGISETTSAATSSDWHLYRLDVTALAGNDIDSPNLAVDDDFIYLTADFFGPDKYLIYIVEKSSVYGGGIPVAKHFLRTGTQSFGIPSMYTNDAPRMYMIEHFDTEPSSQVRMWAIDDPGGSPSIQSTSVSVPTYYNPGDSRSQGTSTQVELFEDRFWSTMYRDGSLWACSHISEAASPRRAVARWYEFEMNGWPTSGNPPTLRQSGTVDPGPGVYATFNSIFADDQGNAVMVFARSSLSEFYSIARSYRLGTDPLGTMSAPATVKESFTAYGSNRWGDYSGVVADPVSPGRFWMHHQYTPGGGAWRTWVQSETLGPVIAVGDAAASPLIGQMAARPSPSAGPTSFSFVLDREARAQLEVYEVSGRHVRTLDLGVLGARSHDVRWDGRADGGAPVADGVYLARLVADGDVVSTSRIVVTR